MRQNYDNINTMGSNGEVVEPARPEGPASDVLNPVVEQGLEAAENPKRKSSWMKNIGSGMRTLRLRKHGGSEKKTETGLNNLASASILEPDYEVAAANPNSIVNNSQHPPPPQMPLPPLPTDSPATSVPPSPSPQKMSQKVKKNKSTDSTSSLKNHTSRLSLREHVKSKSKKADVAAAAGLNSSVPREGSGNQKSSNGPTNSVAENVYKADPARFIGDGLSFKAKLIGILEVSGPRGDRICQEALSELKMAVKAAGEHKQKVTVHVALDGLRVRDEKTGDCLYHHQVHKISFIAQDLTDTRAFGYIFGSPDTGHRFFGIKTEKSANQVVMSMRDLFQVVFDLKKKEIERAKQQLEMQQKFLATRAAETANRSSHKSGIAETYIDGACSVGALRTVNAVPAEADLLNLEVELTSLQEGLDNIHSTLIDTATSHSSFNRGSTASISSDPTNPCSTSLNKYNISNSFAPQQNDAAGGAINQTIRGTISVGGSQTDPFGDSFDPFDSSGTGTTQNIAPFTADPFANVDPFAGTKFAGGLEPSEFLTSDPFIFETPVGTGSFTFPDSGSRNINRQISITSNSSDISSGKASVDVSRPTMNLSQPTSHSPNLNKSDTYNHNFGAATNWTASFDDNFASTNGEEVRNAGNGLGDLFTELDPLGTGRVKPFVDRKDFFQDLKNPPKKLLSEISSPQTSITTTSLTQSTENSLRPNQIEPSSSPLPNSFSTNFNPINVSDLESSGKTHPLNKVDAHLRTSSIRAQLPGDTPPSYSPPPPPNYPPPTTISSSSVSPSVYFVSAPVKLQDTPPSVKKSPQLLRNMTIASAASASHVVNILGLTSPKTLPRSSFDRSEVAACDTIPNITPPPRPPHTTANITRNSKVDKSSFLPIALPRPHSGGEGKRNLFSAPSSQPQFVAALPPEPPPRPFVPNDPVLPPPPLPPKKQSIGPVMSHTLTRVHYNTALKTRSNGLGEASCNFNDLPLPLPLRKGSQHSNVHSEGQQPPRYAYPVDGPPSILPSTTHGQFDGTSLDELDNSRIPISSSHMIQPNRGFPGLTMEAALNQVASLSLSQLAGKLQIPADKLSSCTIQELAIKLTMMNLSKDHRSETVGSLKTLPVSFDSKFGDEDGADDFSIVSATAFAVEPKVVTDFHKRDEVQHQNEPTNYDRYAVFRELAESEVTSGFSVCSSQEALPGDEEEDGQRSRTLTSRGSSSEKTLQAGVDPANGLSTMDDITDANFSEGEEEEKSVLIDEVVDLNLKAEWATFESNFDEQFVPLSATFNKSIESPWDSDVDANTPKFVPSELVTEEQEDHKIMSPKLDHRFDHSSQFDFQLFEKPFMPDPAGRKHSRGIEPRSHVSNEPIPFQRQSSGSSKHSERSLGPRPASSHNVTTSDYSDSGKERDRSRRNPPRNWKDEGRRRTDSRNSGGRRYSRDDSDDGSDRRNSCRQYYYDDKDDVSVSPVGRRRTSRRIHNDEEYYSNASSRQSHIRGPESSRGHSAKYYSQSLHRKDRHGRFGLSGRRPSETEKYSNHESDFDDSYEDERRRGGRASGSGYSRSERDHRLNPRPPSSGSGGRHYRKPRDRDSSREYYHHRHRDRQTDRHSRERNHGGPYHHSRNVDDEYEKDGRGVSEYSDDEEIKSRRIRGRRRPDRDRELRERDPSYHYNNSPPSWESETPPGKDTDEGDGSFELMRGTHLRKSDLDRPRDREVDRRLDRPSSSSYHGDRLDGSTRKVSRYQSDLSLNANKPNPKLSVTEFGFEEDYFLPPTHHQQQQHHAQDHRSKKADPLRSEPPVASKVSLIQPAVNSNKCNSDSTTNNKIFSNQEKNFQQKPPPPESPFEDNFLTGNNVFFPADFPSTPSNIPKNMEETRVTTPNSVIVTPNNKSRPESNSSTGSLEKSDENRENSSPDITGRQDRNNGRLPSEHPHHQQKDMQMVQVLRKPIISDTIHEVPDTEMKKSDSFNIFDREKDPFADDDFFT